MSRALWVELGLLILLAAAASASVPLVTGYFGISWDALNHQLYLGLTAEHPRWDRDVLAASTQTYQYPYSYWPVYRLSLLPGHGSLLGAAWAALQTVMVVIPIWWASLRLLPEGGRWQGLVQRAAACSLAFMSTVVLAGLETTANDILAAVPLLWAVVVSLGEPHTNRRAFTSASLWGVSVAFKLSNGVFLPLLVCWWWQRGKTSLSATRALSLAAGAGIGFGLAYGPWGWTLWQQTGNPFHPFLGRLFAGG